MKLLIFTLIFSTLLFAQISTSKRGTGGNCSTGLSTTYDTQCLGTAEGDELFSTTQLSFASGLTIVSTAILAGPTEVHFEKRQLLLAKEEAMTYLAEGVMTSSLKGILDRSIELAEKTEEVQLSEEDVLNLLLSLEI